MSLKDDIESNGNQDIFKYSINSIRQGSSDWRWLDISFNGVTIGSVSNITTINSKLFMSILENQFGKSSVEMIKSNCKSKLRESAFASFFHGFERGVSYHTPKNFSGGVAFVKDSIETILGIASELFNTKIEESDNYTLLSGASKFGENVPLNHLEELAAKCDADKENLIINGNREKIRLFHNTDEQTVHFISGKLGLDIGFDLWIKLDGQKSLFENLEYILKGAGIAHNLTSIGQIDSQEGSSVVTLEATYNKVLSEEADSVASLARGCADVPAKEVAAELASLAGSNSSQNLKQ
ncbi:MAG: hypothetical protein A3F91_09390 [Flavobacteria bacterium RIFCSPLOWO2_12_FULL_35_11]|nr:MAG: hypothetical protein A3F91_09390 [Flavobacteria bacterium RIFCSPLOWO2_12_FULL_35_11]